MKKKDLEDYLEKNGHCIDGKGAVGLCIMVLEFFKEKIEKESPYAKIEISTLNEAIEFIEGYDLN